MVKINPTTSRDASVVSEASKQGYLPTLLDCPTTCSFTQSLTPCFAQCIPWGREAGELAPPLTNTSSPTPTHNLDAYLERITLNLELELEPAFQAPEIDLTVDFDDLETTISEREQNNQIPNEIEESDTCDSCHL